jgi:phage-related protein
MGLIQGINDYLPKLSEILPTVLMDAVTLIMNNLPLVIDTGISIVESLLSGITSAIPKLLKRLPLIIQQMLQTFTREIPKLLKLGEDLLNGLISGILETIPILGDIIPTIISEFVSFLTTNLPKIIESGINILMSLISGITSAIPMLIDMLPTIIDTTVTTLMDMLPMLIEMGFNMLIGLIDGIISAIPDLIFMLPEIIITITTTLIKNLPKILAVGVDILLELGKGIVKTVSTLVTTIGTKVIPKVKEKFMELPDKLKEVGTNLVQGLWNGIQDATGWLLEKIKGFGESVLNGIKEIFGIASPSKVMRDEVGKYLAEGIGVGFTDEMKSVTKEMASAIPTSFDTQATIKGVGVSGSHSSRFDDMVSAFKEALSQMKVEMDDEEMGKFVDKTVTRLVYT